MSPPAIYPTSRHHRPQQRSAGAAAPADAKTQPCAEHLRRSRGAAQTQTQEWGGGGGVALAGSAAVRPGPGTNKVYPYAGGGIFRLSRGSATELGLSPRRKGNPGGSLSSRITRGGSGRLTKRPRGPKTARPGDVPPAAPHTARIHATSTRGSVSWFSGTSTGIQPSRATPCQIEAISPARPSDSSAILPTPDERSGPRPRAPAPAPAPAP